MLLSLFLDILSFFGDKEKDSCYFSIEYFLDVFGPRLSFFKSVEEVISSEEVSKGSVALRVQN
jgi:hypothetical protein